MKPTFLILFAFAAVPLFAREEALPGSASPDNKFCIVVEAMDRLLIYRVKRVSDAKPLNSILSSYQTDRGTVDWAFKQALGAAVHWRKDSQFVAIDEANFDRMGTVVILRCTGDGFEDVPAHTQELMRASKQPWEVARLFFRDWSRGDTVSIGIRGLLKRFDDIRTGKEFEVSVTLDLVENPIKRIIAIEPEMDATQ